MDKVILVAEDDPGSRELLKFYLKKEGHTVVTVPDGEEAWRLIRKHPEFNLVISDNDMPLLSGLELLQKMREHEETAKTQFILMSGGIGLGNEASFEQVCKDLDARFVAKPVNFDELVAMIS